MSLLLVLGVKPPRVRERLTRYGTVMMMMMIMGSKEPSLTDPESKKANSTGACPSSLMVGRRGREFLEFWLVHIDPQFKPARQADTSECFLLYFLLFPGPNVSFAMRNVVCSKHETTTAFVYCQSLLQDKQHTAIQQQNTI